MKFKEIEIKNFRNFESIKLDLANKNIFFGLNDVGKTNFLYALRFIFDKDIRKLNLFDSDFHNKNIEPIFTAPAGVPDIECLYEGFGAICEVTMLTGRDQWFNEGQPVMRHLRDFENQHSATPNYCLFVAPSLHQDTMNTFWNAVKYEYQGSKQKIVPITITQLIDILQGIKNAKVNHRKVTKDDMKTLYESCTQLNSISDSTQ